MCLFSLLADANGHCVFELDLRDLLFILFGAVVGIGTWVSRKKR